MAKEKNFKERIINTFPFEKNGLTYDLISIDEYSQRKRTYYVSVVDNEGYKYKHFFNEITDKKYHKSHKRFFYHNPYTNDNIKNFMMINNIHDLNILDDISKCTAITPLDVEIKGKIYKISWNDISNNPERFNIENVDNFTDCVNSKSITKEEVSKIIYEMYREKGSALVQDDFDGKTTDSHVGIRLVEKYFGTLVNMEKELNLPIPSEYRILNDSELLDEIKSICFNVEINENRKIIMSSDFRKYGSYKNECIYRNRSKKMGHSLRYYIESFGYQYQKSGNGMNYTFDDGEKVVSKYEYDFSTFLRKNGFIYKKTYFRNICYKELDDEYKGNMNCDYCIVSDTKLIYIELAGILGNPEYQYAYRNNMPIKSKSKELYRQKLNQKREIFERNNLEYYILLPDEMDNENYDRILNKYIKEAA